MLDYPYVSLDEFKAQPHYLDLDNLLVREPGALQDSTVINALLFASTWADSELDMPLQAHLRIENARVLADRHGRLKYHPEHSPVLKVVGLATGGDPASMSSLTDPQVWTEQDGRIMVAYGPSAGAAGIGSLQFGSPPPGVELLTRWTYVAGYPHTQLSTAASAGATTLTVGSTIGMSPATLTSSATVLRIWTPGAEEAVTVASVDSLTSITLTTALRNSHPTVGMSVSAIPPDARMAVIKMACSKLLRKGPLAESAGWTGRGPSPHASSGDPKRTTASNTYHDGACALLSSYKRVR